MLPTAKTPQKEPSPDVTNIRPTPLVNPRKGDYMLNRTQSTGGIAAKISLELKKRYLLDTSALGGNIQRSGSATALDSKLKSFHSNISEHQKLLNPAPEISPTMQAFLQGTSKLHTPLSPSITPKSPTFCLENKLDEIINKETAEAKELKSPEIIDLTLKPNDKFAMQPDITKDVLLEDMHEEKCDSPKPVNDYQPDIYPANDTEGRPRSPVHETSIIVPEIAWNKPEKKSETDIDTDSLSSENSDAEPKIVFNDIPRVEIHDSSGELLDDDIMMDSLCIIPEKSETESIKVSIISEAPKSILSEKKTLNQPKPLPVIENGFGETKCHENVPEVMESGRSTPISVSDPGLNDGTAAALTETELSDWARDGAVSDNLEDVEFDINPGTHKKKSKFVKKKSIPKVPVKIAVVEDFEEHICGKKIPSGINGVPIADFDSIEFMDTGSEVSLDEIVQTANPAMQNKGYVEFVEEPNKNVIETTNNNPIVEAVNDVVTNDVELSYDRNTGYCVYGNEDENVGSFEAEFKPIQYCDIEDDSLLNVEPGTTTEENTCSDSTVKNLNKPNELELSNMSKEVVKLDVENKNDDDLKTPVVDEQNGLEYDEHVKRLQMKYAEFGFVRDSIDIRKSKRKSKSQSPPSQSEISEIKEVATPPMSPAMSPPTSPPTSPPISPKEFPISPTFTSPITSRRLDEINRERTKQKDLIHDLVLERVKTQRRSLDKRRKLRDSFSPSNSPVRTNFDLSKSATVSSVLSENNNTKNFSLSFDSYKPNEKPSIALQRSPTVIGIPATRDNEKENSLLHTKNEPPRPLLRPLSVIEPLPSRNAPSNTETFSTSDIHLLEFKTPIAPPRTKHDTEKLKQDAKIRARLMSDEELGLSPEDKMNVHRQKLQRSAKKLDEPEIITLPSEKRMLLFNDTLTKKKQEIDLLHNSFSSNDLTTNKLSLYSEGSTDALDKRNRTKSVSEICKTEELKKSFSGNIIQRTESIKRQLQFYKSDPNLLTDAGKKEKKVKDRERRKSIIKSVTDFFHKKKEGKEAKSPNSSSSGSVKDRLARFRISPRSKEKSKVSNYQKLSHKYVNDSKLQCDDMVLKIFSSYSPALIWTKKFL